MTTTVTGWVLVIGIAPEYRPYVSSGPEFNPLDIFTETRVDGGRVFPTRQGARAYRASLHDRSDTRIRRATVTLEVQE